mmetsp:Transcript_18378/g.69592  ORF Transcript_18378/g.69592 Transcript_18378/m.69592 type:complete len:211 (+) Transcript_18378:620-1252(+)
MGAVALLTWRQSTGETKAAGAGSGRSSMTSGRGASGAVPPDASKAAPTWPLAAAWSPEGAMLTATARLICFEREKLTKSVLSPSTSGRCCPVSMARTAEAVSRNSTRAWPRLGRWDAKSTGPNCDMNSAMSWGVAPKGSWRMCSTGVGGMDWGKSDDTPREEAPPEGGPPAAPAPPGCPWCPWCPWCPGGGGPLGPPKRPPPAGPPAGPP